MRTLEKPSIMNKTNEIYLECSEDFTSNMNYKDVALKYIDEVSRCSNMYPECVPRRIDEMPVIQINEQEKKIIEKIYIQKFAPQNSIGRKYYNLLMDNAKKCCPICGRGTLSNLDHFLPISSFPLLCVTPLNLVPTCRDCNMGKGSRFSSNYYEIPFHPYMETMEDIWIECKVQFYEDNSYSIVFYNGFDKTKSINLWRKYTAHMKIHHLDDTLCSSAMEELSNVKQMYKMELLSRGKEELTKAILEVYKSAESIDGNSWKAALYRELYRKCDEFCDWLSNSSDIQ